MKKVVQYSRLITKNVKIGEGVLIVPLDHPDQENVSNLNPAWTSPVVAYNEATAEIETRNTLYKPVRH